MKRQIICRKCQLEHPMQEYTGEWGKRVLGISKRNLVCDLCGKNLPVGTPCTAESFGLNTQPYYQWEIDYLNIESPYYER